MKLEGPHELEGSKLEIVGKGKETYIWIGTEKACFGHCDNTERLRGFANELLAALPSPKTSVNRP